jgi:hypothetical protein
MFWLWDHHSICWKQQRQTTYSIRIITVMVGIQTSDITNKNLGMLPLCPSAQVMLTVWCTAEICNEAGIGWLMRSNLMWAMTKNKIHLQSIVNKRQTTPCSPPHRETNVLLLAQEMKLSGTQTDVNGNGLHEKIYHYRKYATTRSSTLRPLL